MRFLGFFYIQEWDGKYNKVSAQEERANLWDWLKSHVNHWVYITYSDGETQRIDREYFDHISRGTFNPNVSDGCGFRY